jgi:subtilisin family serine protease
MTGLFLSSGTPVSAWIHDSDGDRIDDRIEQVAAAGPQAAYVDNDPAKRRIIALFNEQAARAEIEFGIYVGYDHHPTQADADELSLRGQPVKRYEYIDYIRTQATFAEILSIAALPGVVRVEAIPMMYPVNHWGSRVVRARDSRGLRASDSYVLFPSARAELGLDGTGIVIAVLDTGVNDAPDDVNPNYPGHEGLRGKFLGGGEFHFGEPLLNTGLDESTNPSDHGAEASSYHATHVAGTAMGTGGTDGFFAGVAPNARLVDCKVLSDAGLGFGSADGVEWCIHNKNNSWGLSGSDVIYSGIDVLSLSLGGLDASDGTDAGSQMINAAVDAGLAVCIATGNDGATDWIASPAAADKCIAVGASQHSQTLDRSDDRVTDFSNEGPRTDDGDADHFDEMKPSVVGPGAGIISADGDVTTAGGSYKGLSGTSMATPHISGVVALLRQANPGLDPLQIREVLQDTAEHSVPSVKGERPDDPFGLDANYDPACGWGLADTYAAAIEAMDPARPAQVVLFRPIARPEEVEVDVTWTTQREQLSLVGFNVLRAPDAGGSPGVFVQINGPIVPAVGDPILESDGNRTPYTFVDADPSLTLGETYWYRVEAVDAGGARLEPPAPVALGVAPQLATLYYVIQHNTVDNDLFVTLGTSAAADPQDADFMTLGLSEVGQDSVVVHEPATAATATTGYLEHFWSIPLSEGDGVGGYLPPSSAAPWFLNVVEGGYVNRSGTVNAFNLFVNTSPGSADGILWHTNSPIPRPTIETQETTVWIPDPAVVAVPPSHLEAMPDPRGILVHATIPGAATRTTHVLVRRATTGEFSASRALYDDPKLLTGTQFAYVDGSVRSGTTYYYWIVVIDAEGEAIGGPVRVRSAGVSTLHTAAAFKNGNPMRSVATITYSVGEDVASAGAVPVKIVVYDLQGRAVRELVGGTQASGIYETRWDGRDDAGAPASNGVYLVRLSVGSTTRNMKLTVLRP